MNYVILFLDISAALVIGISAVRAILSFFRLQTRPLPVQEAGKETLRMTLIPGLLLGLDFEVGSDILRTVLVTSVDDIIALVVVISLRIALSWSLEMK